MSTQTHLQTSLQASSPTGTALPALLFVYGAGDFFPCFRFCTVKIVV